MTLFHRKRYAFSERLRQRERRRRRLRLGSMFLGFLCVFGFLRASSDSEASYTVGPEQVAVSAPDATAVGAKATTSTVAPTTRPASAAIRSAVATQEEGEAVKTVRASLRSSSVASLTEPAVTAKPVLAVRRNQLKVDSGELERALLTQLKMPSSVNLSTGTTVELSIDPELQADAEKLLADQKVPYGAIVAIEPATGKIVAMAGASTASKESDNYLFALQSGMPAASLIKVIAAAAAVEKGGSQPDDQIRYRGGRYTLNKWNYKPDTKLDKQVMTLEKALATSCNPVFGRLGLQVTGADLLSSYAGLFGFNARIPFVLPLQPSRFAEIVDDYSLALTAAGFGEVTISPLHAAMVMAAIANDGRMMKPMLINGYSSPDGIQRITTSPELFARVVTPQTATVLMEMMESTTKSGTGRRQFSRVSRASKLSGMRIAAKTGTLTGSTPQGRYHWLIAAGPVEKPEIAIAALVVDTGNARINGSGLGRLFLEKYFARQRGGRKV